MYVEWFSVVSLIEYDFQRVKNGGHKCVYVDSYPPSVNMELSSLKIKQLTIT